MVVFELNSATLEKMATPPSPSTLRSFGLSDQLALEPLPGGRGLCYRTGSIVLRPVDDAAEAEWLCHLTATLLARFTPEAYRLAAPIPAVTSPDRFVIDGWTASTYLPGRVSLELNHFPAIFAAIRAFHANLAELIQEKPSEVANRAFNRFDEADHVTWCEKSLDHVEEVNGDMLAQLRPLLGRLESAMRPLPSPNSNPDPDPMHASGMEATCTSSGGDSDPRLRPQLVHMDLLGNILIEKGGPPGIIDLTFYWRPALYAEAVMVADGLVHMPNDADRKALLEKYLREDLREDLRGNIREEDEKVDFVRVQLLIRALHWRYVTFAIDPDLEWIRVNLPKADYAGAANIILGFVEC